MGETEISEGITDITTSEGNLKRFSQICKLIGDQERALPRNRIVQLIKDQIGLTNDKVIGRHISILEKLSILENKEGMYILSSEGKALYDFIEDLKDKNELSSYEITFYFRTLFTHLFGQLYRVLKKIDKHKERGRDFIIIQYFENDDFKLWKKETAKKNLENKFRCMEKWLQTLNLLDKRKNIIKLTEEGKLLLYRMGEFEIDVKDIETRIFLLASNLLYSKKVDEFSYEISEHQNIFNSLLKSSYNKFQVGFDLADIKAMEIWICIKMLNDFKIRIEGDRFYNLLNQLWRESAIVRSMMTGRDSKLAYISLEL